MSFNPSKLICSEILMPFKIDYEIKCIQKEYKEMLINKRHCLNENIF